ncbi:MAG: kdpC [Acidimicrobiia bacterium]|nr:kdpC [Acidimicrobiia bacterium]
MKTFIRQLTPAFLALLVLTVVCGLIYPLAVTAVAQVGFHNKANGSIISVNGQAVGSKLIGQDFAAAKYFHPRPSAAGSGYDGLASGGSNLGPNNPDLLSAVADRAAAYRKENNLGDTQPVPVDAVTASGSGLDPQISIANARIQAPRIAAARNVGLAVVLDAIYRHVQDRPLGILGDPGVNVLELNLALDRSN